MNKKNTSAPLYARATSASLDVLGHQLTIIGALMLREVRARMSGSVFGYLKTIFIPLFHLLIIAMGAYLTGRLSQLGTSPIIFFSSGILPFMMFIYPIRGNVAAIDEGRSLLVFPLVNPIDVIFSRVLLEAINSLIIIFLLLLVLLSAGVDAIPKSPYKALTGIYMTILYSLSFCIPNAVIAKMIPNWVNMCVLFSVALYIASGAFFLPSNMPAAVQEIMYFNPLAHCVEWIRSGYYETYNEGLLDRSYLVSIILFQLTVGLVLERAFRGKLN